MAVFHVTYFFAQPPSWGWREQFWWEGLDQESCLIAAVQLGLNRYSVLGAGVNLSHVVVSIPGVPRAALVAPLSGLTLTTPAMPGVQAVNVRLVGNTTPPHRRSYAMHGLPIGALSVDKGAPQWAPSIFIPVTRWLSLLANSGFRILGTVSLGNPIAITNIASVALVNRDIFGNPLVPDNVEGEDSYVFVQLQQPAPANANQVRIYGVKILPPIRSLGRQFQGTRQITDILPQGILIQGSMWDIDSAMGGFAQFQAEVPIPIIKADVVGYVVRKVGKGKPPDNAPSPSVGPAPSLPAPTFPGGTPLPAPSNAPPPPPPQRTITTMKDLAALVFEGYSPPSPPPPLGIGIARVTNVAKPTWVVVLAGIDNEAGQTPLQWMTAIESGVGLPDPYTNKARQVIEDFTSDDADLIIAGHSLGGMTAHWLNSWFPTLGNRTISRLFTFGAPPMTMGFTSTFIRNYAVQGDPLTYAPPLGNYFLTNICGAVILYYGGSPAKWLFTAGGLPLFGYATVDAGGITIDPYTRHMCYPTLASLDAINWNGSQISSGAVNPLEIGPVVRFDWK